MSILKAASAVLAFALVLGAANPLNAATDEYANVHTVGVISILGNDLDMQTWGYTIFGNEDYQLHTDWNLDDQVDSEVANALKGRFAVKTISIDPQTASHFMAKAHGTDWSAVEKLVRTLPASDGVDAYVVVFPIVRMLGFGQRFWGGLVGRHVPDLRGPHIEFGAYYAVGVIEAGTGKRIDWGTGHLTTHGLLLDNAPDEQCAADMWATGADAITPEQKSRIHQEMSSVISRSIPYTLAGANLLGEADAKAYAAQIALPGDPSCHEPQTAL